MDKKESRKTWENLANFWAKMIVPNRPSQGDCEIYGKFIKQALKNKKNPKVMLMGSTPELRRVLYTSEFLQRADVLCAEINHDMYKAMTNYVMKFGSLREKFVKRAWLKTRFRNKTFDLVVGDEVICNMPRDSHEKLFKEISRILKNDGVWVTRHNVYTKKMEKGSGEKFLQDLAKKIERGEYDFQYAVNVLMAFMFHYAGLVDPKNNTLKGHLKILQKVYSAKHISPRSAKIINEIMKIYKNNYSVLSGDYKWVMLSKNESERDLRKYFIIVGEHHAKDYPTVECSPIYFLKKNN